MTGVLTMGLVMQRSKIDDIQRVQKLNVCNSQLQDIGVLRDALSLEVLSLSLNDLAELGALSNCSRLHELHLRRNQIRDINQVLHLKHLPLDVLNLAENPICRDPNYRRFIIAAIPSLERLDDTNISDDERAGALRVFPELSSFAPPPSRYANNGENTGYVPAPKPAASVRPSTQQQRPSTAGSQRPSSAGIPPTPNRRPESRPASSNYGGATPSNANANRLRSSGSMSVGPSEAGVVQAVKVLCSELSPQALQEVRRFLDSLNGY